MSDLMRLIDIESLLTWSMDEYNKYGRIFGVNKKKFYKPSEKYVEIFGQKVSSVVGPAAGPNSQLSQNIIASYLGGARVIELKTVQQMDGEDLRACVAKPCINAEDECYNVEWSTELTVPEAFDEYVRAYIAIRVLAKELGIAKDQDFVFNMSVGYDLAGIKTEKIDKFIEGLKDASNSEVFKECKEYLLANLDKFENIDKSFVDGISAEVCTSITLSTLHGCPPDEIKRIAEYLLTEKKVHTYIKCNPTILGYERARKIMDEMGYAYVSFDDHHFNDDLQYSDAIVMLEELQNLADSLKLQFGVKITNTFPVRIENDELPGEEMYMSGRSLFPLSINVARILSEHFNGKLRISFSGGADYFNIEDLVDLGITPITVATTILKPGGYERLLQLATKTEKYLKGDLQEINVEKLQELCRNLTKNKYHLKSLRPVGSRKTDSKLPLFDCYKAPCKDGGCPIEQQIPEYLRLVSEGKYEEAFKIIAIDNANPAITGSICDHQCQNKCTRLDYETPLKIRKSKLTAVLNAQDKYIESIVPAPIVSKKKVAVIGAGPAGVSSAYFLSRNGIDVTVFEKRDKPFGIVSTVIPEFRVAKDLVEKDYQMAVKSGAKFKFNAEVGCIDELKKNFDYVIVATGAWEKCTNPIKGKGRVIDALEFLEMSKANNLTSKLGSRVAVIGGGDVAMDCARSAKRTKGVDVSTIVYRRTESFMPSEPEERKLAKADGVVFKELYSPLEFNNGKLLCEIMELGEKDSSGRKGVKGTGKKEELYFDTIIVATGAKVGTKIFTDNKMNVDKWNSPVLNENNESSLANVYVAGDCKVGPATVVKAIADAKAITKDILAKEGLPNDFIKVELQRCACELRDKKGVLATELPTDVDNDRCLVCDQVCELCCDVCPNRANIRLVGNVIVHLDGMCNECGNCGIFCPHAGNPYKDKLTVFWTMEDFEDSTNVGFLKTGTDCYKVRTEDGKIVDYKLGDSNIDENIVKVIEQIKNDYVFYLELKK
ncbi:MAG: putative selenate reductase subunit YgfK [Lachnospirales bacterium]